MYKPINMKRSTKYGNNYWVTFSPKLKRNVKFYSDLEYDNWVFIEINPHIIDFCEQPLKISMEIDGKILESILDMWVLYDDNTEEFIEVKYSCELDINNPKSYRALKQTALQRQWCLNNNYKYRIVTEKELRDNPVYLNNIKHIVSQIKNIGTLDKKDIELFVNIAHSYNSIKEIISNTAFSLEYTLKMLCWLYCKDKCNLNIYKEEINLNTEVNIHAEE